MKKQIFSLVALLLFLMVPLKGQEPNTTQGTENMINVFLDGSFIDSNYLREEFPYVNYVRTTESSDIHILGTRSSTGAGFKYEFYFIGSKQFAGKTDTLSYFSSSQATQTEIRDGYTKVLKMGMMRYMAIANQVIDFDIRSNAPRGGSVVQEDPWNSWVFEADLRGNFSGVETRKTQSYNGGLSATQVTPDWRHELQANYSFESIELNSGDYHSINETTEASFDLLSVKSLGPNAGAGILGHVERNTVDNYDLNYKLSAAVEYNFFPYEMSSRRQLSVGYYFGFDGRDYTDSTVYNKIEEKLLYEQLSLSYSQREQWGNVFASVTFKNHMRDFSENNLAINAGLNIRIWKGLSWNLSGNYTIINDDINISKAEIDPEDLMLGIRSLSTSKSYRFNTGLSFTFGSMYNNVVNTRLRSITGMGGGGMTGGGGGNYSGGGGGY